MVSDPQAYRVVFENHRVRVLEYRDQPGYRTSDHRHPDSVMITLSSFSRTVASQGREVEVELPSGAVRWLDAQEHHGFNSGERATHCVFVELKEPAPGDDSPAVLGPRDG